MPYVGPKLATLRSRVNDLQTESARCPSNFLTDNKETIIFRRILIEDYQWGKDV